MRKMMSASKLRICAAVALQFSVSLAAFAEGPSPQIMPNPQILIGAKQIKDVRSWLIKDIILRSIELSNAKRKGISSEEIHTLDHQWITERNSDAQPLITRALNTPSSNYVTKVQAASGGLYNEIIIFDQTGLNVGQSSITTDYWQGDEDKFLLTFAVGAGAIHIDKPEYDSASDTWRAQLNMTIANARDNKPIGAATVEFNLTELIRRQAKTGT